MTTDDLRVPEAKTIGGNPSRANWAKAFAAMSQKGVFGVPSPESPGASVSAAYNPSGVKPLGSETVSRIADATNRIASSIAGLGDDRPQLVAATHDIIEINSANKSPNGVEKMDKVPTTVFDAIDRMSRQIDSELFVDETETADEAAKDLVAELEEMYENFDKMALDEVKPAFQDKQYGMVGCVKARIETEFMPQIERFVRRVEATDFDSCQKCNITRDDILVRVERLQKYAETILEACINKQAEMRQREEINRIVSGEQPVSDGGAIQTCCRG